MPRLTEEDKKLSPILEEQERDETPKPQYSDREEIYLGGLRGRLEAARDARNIEHTEFDGLSYVQNHERNERWANSTIPPKKNKTDTNFITGTVRQKLMALLAALNNLDLSGDISAFTPEEMELQALGDAMEDIILKTEDLDGDEEKKLMRQYELLKQGSVFVEEIWDEKMARKKKLKVKFDGKISSAEWTDRLQKVFSRPSRNIISGLNVYLGDITQYNMESQPFIFTVDIKPYEEAKKIYGDWERWEFVQKDLVRTEPEESSTEYSNAWSINEVQKDHVEIIKYQDKWNNEFAILINGVLMTPVGLPLPWGYTDYNIAQQNLEPIHPRFAYGNSFVRKIRNNVALLDEMTRLAVLKTQKSFQPPRYNISGRVISGRMFMPGKLLYGIPPNSLPPVEGENVGVTGSELEMINEIKQTIDSQTVSPVFTGQATERRETATAIVEMQRQAKMVLGLVVFAAERLEHKLTFLRLFNILANWFKPTDESVDQARGELRSRFRVTNVERPIAGKSLGRRITVPTQSLPEAGTIKRAEQEIERREGRPIKLIFLNPDEVTSAKITWQIVIRPRERITSETQKLMFRAFMQDLLIFPQLGVAPNGQELANEYAMIWGKDPSKIFKQGETPPVEEETPGAEGGDVVSPANKLPTPERAASQELSAGLGLPQ